MTRAFILLVFFCLGSKAANSQDATFELDFNTLNDFPHYVNDSTWHCGDSSYWSIVKKGKSILPALIELVKDSTRTSTQIPCTELYLAKGDIAFMLIEGIIRVPFFQVTKSQWCVLTVGCAFNYPEGWFEYIHRNREKFHLELLNWYREHESKMKDVNVRARDKTDCQMEFGVETIIFLK